jgi:hypothetical protein
LTTSSGKQKEAAIIKAYFMPRTTHNAKNSL